MTAEPALYLWVSIGGSGIPPERLQVEQCHDCGAISQSARRTATVSFTAILRGWPPSPNGRHLSVAVVTVLQRAVATSMSGHARGQRPHPPSGQRSSRGLSAGPSVIWLRSAYGRWQTPSTHEYHQAKNGNSRDEREDGRHAERYATEHR